MRALLFLALVPLLDTRPAAACSILSNQEQQLDAAYANDIVAPSSVTASFEISRSGDHEGCNDDNGTCGRLRLASVDITVDATDDAAPTDKLGYQLRFVTGELPDGLEVPGEAISALGGGLTMFFNPDDTSAFSFDLEIRARDLNGNLGPPTVITVSEPGEAGCSTGHALPGNASTLGGVLVALALVLRRRRRY